ncbi:hypothetical protein BKA93DRAFT_879017 [Sparassis latifolia]
MPSHNYAARSYPLASRYWCILSASSSERRCKVLVGYPILSICFLETLWPNWQGVLLDISMNTLYALLQSPTQCDRRQYSIPRNRLARGHAQRASHPHDIGRCNSQSKTERITSSHFTSGGRGENGLSRQSTYHETAQKFAVPDSAHLGRSRAHLEDDDRQCNGGEVRISESTEDHVDEEAGNRDEASHVRRDVEPFNHTSSALLLWNEHLVPVSLPSARHRCNSEFFDGVQSSVATKRWSMEILRSIRREFNAEMYTVAMKERP